MRCQQVTHLSERACQHAEHADMLAVPASTPGNGPEYRPKYRPKYSLYLGLYLGLFPGYARVYIWYIYPPLSVSLAGITC